MKEVRIKKTEFVNKVTSNREAHRKLFLNAIEGYRKLVIEELENRIADVKAGKKIENYIHLDEPTDHTNDYDQVLLMARMSLDDEIVLSKSEFSMYVMDQWGWKESFLGTSSKYTA